MLWNEAKAAIKAHISTQWAAGEFSAVQLVFESDIPALPDSYVHITIEGVWADKTIYGSVGKRSSMEGGIVYFHCFAPMVGGDALATEMVDAMTAILELQTISGSINLEGGDPPTPIGHGDDLASSAQPGGNYYRSSGSVPFISIGTR